MKSPEPDWFPSRVDLRQARRWERTRWAVALNLLFLGAALIFGWFGTPKNEGVGLALFLVSMIIAFSVRFHSFIRISEREQLEDLARRLGLTGCHVTCRFFEGDFEVGSDDGYLAQDGGMLRFEGITSRFALTAASLVHEPDLKARNPELELDSMRIRIKPDRDIDADDASVYLNRWLRDGGATQEERLPPRTPQARSWNWYFERAVERYHLALSFAVLATHFRLFIPESLKWLRYLIIGLPVVWISALIIRAAVKLRREDRERLAQRISSALPSSDAIAPLVETPLKVSAS